MRFYIEISLCIAIAAMVLAAIHAGSPRMHIGPGRTISSRNAEWNLVMFVRFQFRNVWPGPTF